MLRPLELLFLQILAFFHQFTGNYGWDIILLTLLVRLVLFPVTMVSVKSMKKMQVIQPRMKELQAKYKENKEKLNQEMMKLYKETGVNPFLGCLPMALQFPIWIALFQVLRFPHLNGYLLVNSSFYGMDLTTAPFSRITGGFLENINLCLPGMVNLSPLAGLGIGFFNNAYLYLPSIALVAFAIVTMYFQQKTMQMDPSQAGQMVMMNVMFAVFTFMFPTGVLLYMDVSNLIQIAQQKFTGTGKPAPAGKSKTKQGVSAAAQEAVHSPDAKNGQAAKKEQPPQASPQNTKQTGKKPGKRRRKRKK